MALRSLVPNDRINMHSAPEASSAHTPGQQHCRNAIHRGIPGLFDLSGTKSAGPPDTSLLHPAMAGLVEAQTRNDGQDKPSLELLQSSSTIEPATFHGAKPGTSATPHQTDELVVSSSSRRSRNNKPLWCIDATCDKTYQKPVMLAKHIKEYHGHAEIVPQWVDEQGTRRLTNDQQSCWKKLLARMKSGLTKEAYETERAAFIWNTHSERAERRNDRNNTVQNRTVPRLQTEHTHQGLVSINDQLLDQILENWVMEFPPSWLLSNESANVGHWDPAARD